MPRNLETDKVKPTNQPTKMKITLTTNKIAEMIRQDSPDSWSYNGAKALAEYMEEFEEESGEEIEFDDVEIRCGFSEYDSLLAFAEDNSKTLQLDKEKELDELEEEIREFIQDRGHLIEFDGGIIVSAF